MPFSRKQSIRLFNRREVFPASLPPLRRFDPQKATAEQIAENDRALKAAEDSAKAHAAALQAVEARKRAICKQSFSRQGNVNDTMARSMLDALQTIGQQQHALAGALQMMNPLNAAQQGQKQGAKKSAQAMGNQLGSMGQ